MVIRRSFSLSDCLVPSSKYKRTLKYIISINWFVYILVDIYCKKYIKDLNESLTDGNEFNTWIKNVKTEVKCKNFYWL